MSYEQDPNYVRIFSTDLRDGEQTPGVHFGKAEKVEFAQAMEAIGVDIIEAGFANSGPEDFEAIRAVAVAVGRPVVCSLARIKELDVDRAGEAIEPAMHKGGGRIHVFAGTSSTHMKKNGMTPEQVLRDTATAVTRAVNITPDVEYSGEDGSRSELDFLIRAYQTAVEHGATTINVPDTVGFSLPSEYGRLVAAVRRAVIRINPDVVISTHCHDDLGNANANSIAGVQNGARQVEGVFSRRGERTSNASIEIIAATIDIKGSSIGHEGSPLTHGIDSSKLYEICQLSSRLSGYDIDPTSPVVGANAFTDVGGTHQAGTLKESSAYRIMNPANFGHPGSEASESSIGKLSGGAGVDERLQLLALAVDEDSLRAITTAVKAMANQRGRTIFDNELEAIAAEILGIEIEDEVKLLDWKIEGGPESTIAEVRLTDKGVKTSGRSYGVGAIDALRSATDMAIDPAGSAGSAASAGDIEDFRGGSVVPGSDGKFGLDVAVVHNGYKVTAHVESSSVDGTGIVGYITALNMIRRANDRA